MDLKRINDVIRQSVGLPTQDEAAAASNKSYLDEFIKNYKEPSKTYDPRYDHIISDLGIKSFNSLKDNDIYNKQLIDNQRAFFENAKRSGLPLGQALAEAGRQQIDITPYLNIGRTVQ
jgi:hypothetical protein